MHKRYFLFMAALMLSAMLAQSVFAQSSATGRSRGGATFTVTINSNIRNSTVYVDGQWQGQGTPLQVQLSAGQHDVQVTADGYSTWQNRVNVDGNVIVNAVLRQAQYTMRVTSNVTGASVTINGQQQGSTPLQVTVQPGRFDVQVTANGYSTWQNTLNITGDTQVNADLQPMRYTLQVNANVTGASVQVGGAPNGTTPYSAQVQSGTYVVTISAPGYLPYTTSVTVNSNQTVQAVLQASKATLHVQIANQDLNPYMTNPWSQISWFVDNNQVSSGGSDTITVDPGVHRIRVVSGGLSAEGTFNVQAGQTYNFELHVQLDLRNNR